MTFGYVRKPKAIKMLRMRRPMSKRDEFIRKMKDRLDGWNLEIDALEEKFRKIKTDMTDKYKVQIDELRKKRREGDRKLEQIRTAGEGTWTHLKAESEHAWNAMKDALEAFKSHYRNDSDSSKRSDERRE
jgi:DNA repair ATPase RecN